MVTLKTNGKLFLLGLADWNETALNSFERGSCLILKTKIGKKQNKCAQS